jgi:hypothetical protein
MDRLTFHYGRYANKLERPEGAVPADAIGPPDGDKLAGITQVARNSAARAGAIASGKRPVSSSSTTKPTPWAVGGRWAEMGHPAIRTTRDRQRVFGHASCGCMCQSVRGAGAAEGRVG